MMNTQPFLVTTSGVRMPKIIYGTAWKKERTAALVEQAIRQGFRGIDTACQPKHYDEPGVGTGIAHCIEAGLIQRDEIYLQTKFTPLNGHDPLRIPYDARASLTDQVKQSVQRSLQNLQTDYLDGLILHSPLSDRQQLQEVWQSMSQCVRDGTVKQLGISNCYSLDTLSKLYDSAEIKPVILQNRFYADTHYDRELRTFCQQHQMIYQSFWTLTANPVILTHATLKTIAQRYGLSREQVFFRYLTKIGIVPLTGTTSEQHMRADLAIFEFDLSGEECLQIGELLQ